MTDAPLTFLLELDTVDHDEAHFRFPDDQPGPKLAIPRSVWLEHGRPAELYVPIVSKAPSWLNGPYVPDDPGHLHIPDVDQVNLILLKYDSGEWDVSQVQDGIRRAIVRGAL